MSTPAPGPIGARLALPRRATFWCLAGVLCLFMFAAAAPSPLYTVYQAQWRFSATTLTAVFAIYALTLLSALLVLGSLSDHLGRRPVIVAALALNAGATALFLAAHGVALLFAARALQGVATGMATSALSASLIELQPAGVPQLAPMVNSAAPAVGLGTGALATSALVQYGPAPSHFVYWLLLAGFLAGIVGVLATPEPGTHRPGALSSLRPRAGMPQEARATFAAVLPSLLALWALAGLYLSLGPSLAAQLVGSHNLLWGGLVIFLLQGFAATASMLLRATEPQTAMLAGSLTLLAGLAVTLAGIAAGSAALFLPGTSIAGCGFGLAFLGVFRTLSALAPPEERAAMIATIYIASYLAFGIPVVIAGVAATHAGLHDTSIAYGLTLAALVGAAVIGMTVRRRRARLPAPQSTQLRAHHVPPVPDRSHTTSHGTARGERLWSAPSSQRRVRANGERAHGPDLHRNGAEAESARREPSRPVRCSQIGMPASSRIEWAGRSPSRMSSTFSESIPTSTAASASRCAAASAVRYGWPSK